MSATHYRHSGKVSPLAVVTVSAAFLLVGPLLALIYSALIIYIPIVYVNVLLTLAFGGGVGVAVGMAARMGHARNTPLTMLAGMGAAGFAYWLHWVFWFGVHAVGADGDFSDALVLLFPPALFDAIDMVNAEGTWGFKSSDAITGGLLTTVWVIEAILFFVAAIGGTFVAAPAVYCESCGTWCVPRKDIRRYGAMAGGEAFVERLNRGDLNVLMEGPASEPGAAQWTRLDLDVCESCGQTNTLSFKAVQLKTDNKGNTSEDEDVLVEHLLLTPEQTRWVLGP